MHAPYRLIAPSSPGRSTWRAAFVSALLPVALTLVVSDARAQSNACEMLKSTLTARIDPSIRGFSMEIVPAAAPVPPGAKVIGNCETGARKILFRRFGGGAVTAASAPEAADALAPSPAPQAVVKAAPPPTVAPKKVEPAKPMSPLVQSDRDLRSMPAPSPRASEPVRVLATVPVRVRAAEPMPAPPAPAPPEAAPEVAPSPPETAPSDFMEGRWRWAWALLLLPLAAWGWAWLARRRAYDEAGLPRGPKLN